MFIRFLISSKKTKLLISRKKNFGLVLNIRYLLTTIYGTPNTTDYRM